MPGAAEICIVLLTAIWTIVVDPPLEVAAARAYYLEDDADARPVAAIRAALFRHRGEARLTLHIAAIAPGVAPAFGSDGVAGANIVTASELALLEDGGDLRFELRPPASQPVLSGVAARGPVPLTRFDAASARFTSEPSTRRLPLAWQAVSPPLPAGRHSLVAIARGVPRLTVAVTIDSDGRASIDAILSLGTSLATVPDTADWIRRDR